MKPETDVVRLVTTKTASKICKKINDLSRRGIIVTVDHERVMGARVKDGELEVNYWDDPLKWVLIKPVWMNESEGRLEVETSGTQDTASASALSRQGTIESLLQP